MKTFITNMHNGGQQSLETKPQRNHNGKKYCTLTKKSLHRNVGVLVQGGKII